MKSEKLIEFIRHPDRIGSDEIRELQALVDHYPYFQTARILYLKALYMTGGIRFRSELKSSTVHITAHKQLFKYLNNQIEFESSAAAVSNHTLTDLVDERIREIYGHTIADTYGIPAFPERRQEEGEEQEEEIVQLDWSRSPAPQPLRRLHRPQPPEGEVVSNPLQLDHVPGMIDDYAMPAETEIQKPTPVQRPAPAPFSQSLDLSGMPGMIAEEEPAPEAGFSLDINLDDDLPDTSGEKNELSAPVDIPEIRAGSYRLDEEFPATGPAEENTTEKKRHKTRKKKEELIEKFIQSEPAMPRVTAATTDTRDLSKENPYAEEELFSETLAKIYVKQHLYEKAISTYTKLSLKYPEKSVYFANRIENIKANINNKE